MAMQGIYLDHNATSPLRADVAEVLREALEAMPANPGSVHRAGQRARALLEEARREMLQTLFGGRGRIVLTSSATEANNLALRNAPPGTLYLSGVDHPSLTATAESLAAEGRSVRHLPVTAEGGLQAGAISGELRTGGGGLLCVTWANNELGTVADLAGLVAELKGSEVRIHVDAAQVFGRYGWQLPEGVDSCAFGAHKAGGPVGVGGLWLRDPGERPRGLRGGFQERGSRAGTEAVWLVRAMARTLCHPDPRWERLEPVRSAFEQVLVGEGGARVLCGRATRAPNTTKVVLPHRSAEEALAMLDLAGIAASAGSACTAGSIDPSPVVLALGVSEEDAARALRFSFGPEHEGVDGEALARRVLAIVRGEAASG